MFFLSKQRRIHQLQGRPEPPIVPSVQTLKNVKHENKISQYLHEDLIAALFMLKNNSVGRNVIHEIGKY